MHIKNNIPKSRKTVSRKALQQLESNVSVILIVASKVAALNDFTHLDVWLQKCLYNQFKNPSYNEDNDNGADAIGDNHGGNHVGDDDVGKEGDDGDDDKNNTSDDGDHDDGGGRSNGGEGCREKTLSDA